MQAHHVQAQSRDTLIINVLLADDECIKRGVCSQRNAAFEGPSFLVRESIRAVRLKTSGGAIHCMQGSAKTTDLLYTVLILTHLQLDLQMLHPMQRMEMIACSLLASFMVGQLISQDISCATHIHTVFMSFTKFRWFAEADAGPWPSNVAIAFAEL